VKSFRQYLKETNNTGNMLYFTASGAGFAVDTVSSDFDVDQYDGESKNKMKPWEVRNALQANERRESVLRWLKAAGGGNRSVNNKSIPMTPDWQSEER
jgi:hypothetical protein